MRTFLTLLLICSSLSLFSQSFAVGGDYYPLNKKATYFYKATISDGNEILQKFVHRFYSILHLRLT